MCFNVAQLVDTICIAYIDVAIIKDQAYVYFFSNTSIKIYQYIMSVSYSC